MSSQDARIVVEIKNIRLHPERSELVGTSLDEETSYVLKLSREEFADLLEQVAPLAPGRCPRCDFEEAISVLSYSGEYIRGHFGDKPGQLSASEVAILELAQAWEADDAIERCLNGDATREH